jgi:chromosome segregation ATPase
MCGIQPCNSFNFALQNSIKRLSSLPKSGLLDALSEVVGTKGFDKNTNTVLSLLDKSESVETKIITSLDSIKEKLDGLKVD